jgi:hypothetical protein
MLRFTRIHSRPLLWKLGLLVYVVTVLGLGLAWYLVEAQRRETQAPNDFDKLECLTLLNDPRLLSKLIRTGEADYRYNCHGWTFTRGEREVSADEVQEWLQEDYRSIDTPELGDIVVYCDHVGQIMHSGVVKALGENGFVLVESKWGTAGRFLHEPTISRGFTSFNYFHKSGDVAKAKSNHKVEAETVEAETVEAVGEDQ